MSALDILKVRLEKALSAGMLPLHTDDSLNQVLADLERLVREQGSRHVPRDLQMEAVRRFWKTSQIQTYRDAYLLSWGLCLPHEPEGACVLEDNQRFHVILDGLTEWKLQPRNFRRCYLGLVSNYFLYGSDGQNVTDSGRENWRDLRHYLYDHNELIWDKEHNPEWVGVAMSNQQLFTADPCAPYADALLQGSWQQVDHICKVLGIGQASWFQRELILSQIKKAVLLSDDAFRLHLEKLLKALAHNQVLRDCGLTMLLNRYVRIPGQPLHPMLRDCTVQWWGNPWLPSNRTRWGGVDDAARDMVSHWLKGEFIEAFFTKMAEDGTGDTRRVRFWMRYLKSMDHIEFALGPSTRRSTDKDLKTLLGKMDGLLSDLESTGDGDAFIMYLGDLVAVEFSQTANACYGYRRDALPFDMGKTLRASTSERNSLKNPLRGIRLKHYDGTGWWEDKFRDEIRNKFGILPDDELPEEYGGSRKAKPMTISKVKKGSEVSVSPSVHGHSVRAPLSFSRTALKHYAKELGLDIEDNTQKGGSLWVRTDDQNSAANDVLTRWGFHYKPGKGWWRAGGK